MSTTACTLLKEYSLNPNLELIIISETFSPEMIGDTSPSYWAPYGLESIDERTLSWAGYTYDIFINEFFLTKATRAGIMKMPAYTLNGFHCQTKNHLKPTSGFVMTTIAVEVRYYLEELHRFLERDSRVKFIKKKIHSFNELANQTDVIINCTGLGSKQLANDQTIRSARGRVTLRPYRDNRVRLEHEKTTDCIDIVHCYGHSGSGITLSWGCARDVVDIINILLPFDAKQQEEVKDKLPLHEQLWRLIENRKNTLLQSKY